jgi:hypothetical protein
MMVGRKFGREVFGRGGRGGGVHGDGTLGEVSVTIDSGDVDFFCRVWRFTTVSDSIEALDKADLQDILLGMTQVVGW